MINAILIILAIYALIGGATVGFLNFKKSAGDKTAQKERWVKYFVYILLLCLVLGSMFLGKIYFQLIATVLGIGGIFEILRVGRKGKLGKGKIVLALLVFLILYGLFQKGIYDVQIELIMLTYFLVVIFDAFSQLSGQLFGKKSITSISPNKTWGGLAGGLVITVSTMLLLKDSQSLIFEGWQRKVVYALVVSFGCFGGDLLASYYKRICGVKDYSKLLPGQGGLLDRYDSFLAMGLVYFILKWFY